MACCSACERGDPCRRHREDSCPPCPPCPRQSCGSSIVGGAAAGASVGALFGPVGVVIGGIIGGLAGASDCE